jgi:hypothetical protein
MKSRISVFLVIVAACSATYYWVYLPYRCNLLKRQVMGETSAIEQAPLRHDTIARATRNVSELSNCLRHCPNDVELLMLTGANLFLAGRHAAAGNTYCGALRFDRRPELYMGCGELQLLVGDRQRALEHFVRAAEFAGLELLSSISDGELRMAAHRIVGERMEYNLRARGELDERNLVPNGLFAAAQAGGAVRSNEKGEFHTPAESWRIETGDRGAVEATVIRSPRRAAGHALRVRATPKAGVTNMVPVSSHRARVVASAWVLVNKGTVCLGSGNGREPLTNVCSRSTGTWEKLESMNETCPFLMVTLLSAADEGSDFIVDEVRARTTLVAPCRGE